ncbi:AAA family ATPase [Vulcaniibacterium thermophilum]|uniref:Chromosome segregation protein SMC n=1 Tax=Vulcaniibacterium thermophilum TaxID=1169913 RepID=A0A918Z149_9GAMM|nr:ATP-binding protein [Vulcaniibacterium thermophilum]GHE32515.1 chromosome segregation protein SMC [Vulcaniibacterium thermophilum]
MYISRFRLRNWKNFQSVDTRLGGRAFVIGPNASGKSNLLDGFRFLRDVARDGLKKAVDDQRGGISAIRCLAARRHSHIELLVELREAPSADGPPDWEYELVVNQDNNKRPQVIREVVRKGGAPVLMRPDESDEADPQRRTQTALEQISLNKEFRAVAEFFDSISYQHLLPQVVRDPRSFTSGVVSNDPFGRDFLLRILQTRADIRKSRLEKIRRALAVAVPQLVDLDAEMDKSGVPHLWGAYEHWRPNAARQNESQFSDGTLRLLGLLWSMFEGGGPLLLEEPEISLHPDVVRQIPRLFDKIQRERKIARQLIVSTHSEDLLSDPSIALEEIVLLVPSAEGTEIVTPTGADFAAVKSGLRPADVMLPKAAPKSVEQLTLAF